MSFIDNAMEVLDHAEASLHAVIADALAAKAYKEIATIAAMAEAVAAISVGRGGEPRRISSASPVAGLGVGATLSATDTAKAVEPSWMRPKT
jgi:hypothetical protein